MTTFTINTRNHGAIEFTCPDEGGYVRANGKQIGSRGYMGNMHTANAETLEKVARKWHKNHMAGLAEWGGAY